MMQIIDPTIRKDMKVFMASFDGPVESLCSDQLVRLMEELKLNKTSDTIYPPPPAPPTGGDVGEEVGGREHMDEESDDEGDEDSDGEDSVGGDGPEIGRSGASTDSDREDGGGGDGPETGRSGSSAGSSSDYSGSGTYGTKTQRAQWDADFRQKMRECPILFADGQQNQLKAMLHLHAFLMASLLKSGGNCTPKQQMLDVEKFFMNLRKIYAGKKMQKLLTKPDADLFHNPLSEAAVKLLNHAGMELSHVRIFQRYYSLKPDANALVFTERSIRSGWQAVNVGEFFNQEAFLNKCPGYRAPLPGDKIKIPCMFTEEQKDEIAHLITVGAAKSLTRGAPPEELLYELFGHIVGVPLRGLASVVREQNEAALALHRNQVTEQRRNHLSLSMEDQIEALFNADLNDPPTEVQLQKVPKDLDCTVISCWRAVYLPSKNLYLLQAVRARRLIDEAEAKENAAKLKLANAASKKLAKDNELEFRKVVVAGPRSRGAGPAQRECANPMCCASLTGLKNDQFVTCTLCQRFFCATCSQDTHTTTRKCPSAIFLVTGRGASAGAVCHGVVRLRGVLMVRCAFWCDLVIMSKPGFSKKRGSGPGGVSVTKAIYSLV